MLEFERAIRELDPRHGQELPARVSDMRSIYYEEKLGSLWMVFLDLFKEFTD